MNKTGSDVEYLAGEPAGAPYGKGPGGGDSGKLRRMVLGLVVVGVILAAAFWAFLRVGGSPGFYARFPWLSEYVSTWKGSSHAEVGCTECHFDPGPGGAVRVQKVAVALVAQALTGTGSTTMFQAAPEEGCVREGCHVEVPTGGELGFHGVKFSHADHLGKIKRGLKPACTTCHQSLVHGEQAPVSTEACTLCHFRKLGWEEDISRCQLCHDVTKLPADRYDHALVARNGMACVGCHAEVNEGDGEVDRDRCVVCHVAGNRTEKFGDVESVHSIHVDGQGFPCTFCHHPIRHRVRPLAIASDDDCHLCHANAHGATRSLYLGVPADEPSREAMPDAMARVHVHCDGCHVEMSPTRDGEVRRPTGQACNDCHGPGYEAILRDWKAMLQRNLASARRAVRAAGAAAGGRRAPAEAREALRIARERLRQVEAGHGVHNVVFAVVQLDGAVEAANRALRAAGSGTRFARIADAQRLTANECARCHTAVPATVKWKGSPFPHARHADSLGDCTSCHTPYADHGKLAWGKDACGTCHGGVPVPHPAGFRREMGRYVEQEGFDTCRTCHGDEAARQRCTPCHEGGPEAEIDWKGMSLSHANHARHGIDCTTCHTELDAHGGVALTPAECNECHGVTLPHPEDFAETHGELFRKQKLDLETCSTCHEGGMPGEFCQMCHG